MSNIEKIKAEFERRKGYISVTHFAEDLLAFIDSLPEENNPEPYNPVYDEDYLNEKIAKATKSWKGVDVNKMLADCRGYEEKPSEDLNKLIQKWDKIDINTVLKVKVKATGKVIDGFYDGRGHFDHFIDHNIFDRYSIDEVELMPDEGPSEDLNDEIKKFIEEYGYERGEDKLLIAIVARHFAEWGAKHLK